MSIECSAVHSIVSAMERHFFPYNENKIPRNGIYILFEKEEKGHNLDRIVRVGTHTGDNQLRPRLKQHFLSPNKDRSIFRKNIGRSILNKNNDPFLHWWDLDLTTKLAKEKYKKIIDTKYQKIIEQEVTQNIQNNFSFVVFEVNNKSDRLKIESQLISTVSLCYECIPSNAWLGNHSPKAKIVGSGLWLVNQLYKQPFSVKDVEYLSNLING